jgi:hypothetical protein
MIMPSFLKHNNFLAIGIKVKNGIVSTIDEPRKGWILMRGGLSYVQFVMLHHGYRGK